jgi:RNA polymerase sigma-70 factor, ECF subfamily
MSTASRATCYDMHFAEPAMPRNDELVTAAQGGSARAFAELHAIYSRRLFKTIIAITRNREDAEDALQDTFLRAHLALHTFEGRSNIYSWLTRIAINSALMMLRKRRARPEVLFDPHPDGGVEPVCFEVKDSAPDPEQIYQLRQLHSNMERAICNLHPQLRTPLQIQMTRGWSIKEIGAALSISEAAVKTRLHRARRRISAARDLKRTKAHRSTVEANLRPI